MNLSGIRQISSAITNSRLVYSTAAKRPALLDSFAEQLKNPKKLKHCIEKARKISDKSINETDQLFVNALESEGLNVFLLKKLPNESKEAFLKRLEAAGDVDVFIQSRTKSLDSAMKKAERNIEKIKNFGIDITNKETQELSDEAQSLIYEFLSENKRTYNKFIDRINDILGYRFIMNKETKGNEAVLDKIFKAVAKKQKQSNITFDTFESYHGNNIKPYCNSETVKKYFGDDAIFGDKLKNAGYTRINSDAHIKNINADVQFGGYHTTVWGDVEHLLYDLRQGKKLDLSHYNNGQKKIARSIIQEYKKLLKNEKLNNDYSDYLTDVWNCARKAEQQHTALKLPKLPQGINPVLSAENVLKLYSPV